jgi:glycerate kinase
MKILIALDKFKGSISARDAINEITSGLTYESSGASITSLPISDGGGGALEILTECDFTLVEIESVDALLDPKRASYALSQDGKNVFIEMASICGISDIPHLDAFGASSLGIGLAAKEAISQGASAVTISLGGSASTDGGLGFLIGIGAIAKDSLGNLVEPNLNGLKSINSLSLDLIPKNITWTFLVDVANPLVGAEGSAYIFGPQKGLKDEELPEADALLNKWADLLEDISGKDSRHL